MCYDLSLVNLKLFIPRSFYLNAHRAFTYEQYSEAVNILAGAIFSNTEIGSEDNISVYDAILLIARCYHGIGDFKKAQETCSLLKNSEKWDENEPSVQIIFASRDLKVVDSFSALFADIDVEDCILRKDFDAREKLLIRGFGRLRLGQYQQAVQDFETGYMFSVLAVDYRLQAEHSNSLGLYYFGTGNIRHAVEWFKKALATGQKTNAPRRLGISYLNIGICMYKVGDYKKSLVHLKQSKQFLRVIYDPVNLCRVDIAMAYVYRQLCEYDKAHHLLVDAYTLAAESGFSREECLALEFLGDIGRDQKNFEDAMKYYQRGLAIAHEIAPKGDLVHSLIRRSGECSILLGRPGDGLENLVISLKHARTLGDRFEEGIILRCLAQGFLYIGDFSHAYDYSMQACTLLEELDARHEHAIARLVAAEIQLRSSKVCEDESPRDLLDQAWENTVIAQGFILKLDIEYWTEAVKKLQSQIMKRRVEEQKYQAGAVVRSGVVEPRSGKRAKGSISVIIAESRGMREVLQAARAFAPYDESVLLTGETGTGKELVAEILHQFSGRKDRPLISVNIAAIPQSMFEREFFGHARGAFSSADTDSIGLAAAADGGTLFLDEIGDLPQVIQVKLLRLLQDGSYLRLGDPQERHADLRIIAATNKDLQKEVAAGRFREDLFYRLASLEIDIPPLRERTEDILPLLEHFLSQAEERVVTIDQFFSPLSQRLLTRHAWPGNVREIIQVARRAFISKQQHGQVEMTLGSGDNLVVLTWSDAMAAAAAAGGEDKEPIGRARLLLALEECDGNRTEAARMLGISRSALYRRLEKFGLD